MSSTLSAHSPKFESQLVTLDALHRLPEPVALGRMHKPVPHAVLVDAIVREAATRGYAVARGQYAVGHKGSALFGVIDLKVDLTLGGPDRLVWVPAAQAERSLSFGFRNSTDQSLAIRGVAGTHVFVCDNLSLSGDTFALEHKNTTGLDLGDAMARGFDKFLKHAKAFELQVARLQGTAVTDGRAKQVIYDVFAARIVPARLFDDVDRYYFSPTDETPDTQARTLWGLHNAFTRAMRDLTALRLFGATVALGKALGLSAMEETQASHGWLTGPK